jgi:hypothetical protein
VDTIVNGNTNVKENVDIEEVVDGNADTTAVTTEFAEDADGEFVAHIKDVVEEAADIFAITTTIVTTNVDGNVNATTVVQTTQFAATNVDGKTDVGNNTNAITDVTLKEFVALKNVTTVTTPDVEDIGSGEHVQFTELFGTQNS